MDLNNPYLTQQIIAYIGNKRRLLNLIHRGVSECLGNTPAERMKFFDVFSGSGVVSRLGKFLGFQVYANDWEYYSYILNRGYLATDRSDIPRLFGSMEAFSDLLERINSLPPPPEEERYVSRYYSPGNDDIYEADFRTERLFYTRENGLAIDSIRYFIEEEYSRPSLVKQKDLLTALLLYEAATHTNTSGVFKAFHKGFGGHGRDAMKRITTPIGLSPPPLIDGRNPVRIYREDANLLVRQKGLGSMDLAYLDPPYNQHQYGSNYHMLNTIALWDRIPAPLELNDKGVLKEKAAIRKDWVKTRSDYCYQEPAVSSFRDLMDNIDARHILISYSTDGIIPFEVMKDLCAKRGDISLVTNEYTTFRGGRQSNSRRISNIEFIMIVHTERKIRKSSVREVDELINRKKLLLLFKQKFAYGKLITYGKPRKSQGFTFSVGKKTIEVPGRDGFSLSPPENLEDLSMEESDTLHGLLSRCLCYTKEDELEELLNLAARFPDERISYIKQLPETLKKLAHRKNRKAYYHWLEKIEKLPLEKTTEYEKIRDKLETVKSLAEKRFAN